MRPYGNNRRKRDCGPICIKYITDAFFMECDLDTIYNLCVISKEGASIKNILYTLNNLGIKSLPILCNMENLFFLKSKLPVIAYLHNTKHFIVIKAIYYEHLKIFDPIYGDAKYTFEQFKLRWLYKRNEGILLLHFRN